MTAEIRIPVPTVRIHDDRPSPAERALAEVLAGMSWDRLTRIVDEAASLQLLRDDIEALERGNEG
jgi:hypothetical protein